MPSNIKALSIMDIFTIQQFSIYVAKVWKVRLKFYLYTYGEMPTVGLKVAAVSRFMFNWRFATEILINGVIVITNFTKKDFVGGNIDLWMTCGSICHEINLIISQMCL